MCLLAILFRVAYDAPLVIAANREEEYARGGTPPEIRDGPVRFAAGLDPLSGGTWFGVNAAGLAVAVTNRRRTATPAAPRSRGLLARDLLAAECAAEALERATAELAARPYAGCNLLLADAGRAFVVANGDWVSVRPLPPGAHAVTNGELNDPRDTRLNFVLEQLRARDFEDGEEAVASLRRICAHVRPGPAVCLRGPGGGTVSSTVLALRQPVTRSTLAHAQGPPDRSPYQDLSPLMQRLGRPK